MAIMFAKENNHLMMQAAGIAFSGTWRLLYLSYGIKLVLRCEHLPSACVHDYVIQVLLECVHLQSSASGSRIQSVEEGEEVYEQKANITKLVFENRKISIMIEQT